MLVIYLNHMVPLLLLWLIYVAKHHCAFSGFGRRVWHLAFAFGEYSVTSVT